MGWREDVITEIGQLKGNIATKTEELYQTKEEKANKKQDLTSVSPDDYPSVPAVKTALDALEGDLNDYTDQELANYIPKSQKGQALGVVPLDAGKKIASEYLPSTLMKYKGVWDLSTNTPTLADGTGENGFVYKVTGAANPTNFDFGSGNIELTNGDFVIYNGDTGIWEKSDGTDAVVSVNGKQGVVVIQISDIPNLLAELNSKTDKGGYAGTAQDLKDAVDLAQSTASSAQSDVNAVQTELTNYKNAGGVPDWSGQFLGAISF